MTARARRIGTYGVVLAIAAVCFFPWISLTGSRDGAADSGLGGWPVLIVPLLIAMDAIHRHDRTIAAIFLAPIVAFSLWVVDTTGDYAAIIGAAEAHPGAGVYAALFGCAVTYASLCVRRPTKAVASTAAQAAPSEPGVDVLA